MVARWKLASMMAVLAAFPVAPAAMAQTGRLWIDPPESLGATPPKGPDDADQEKLHYPPYQAEVSEPVTGTGSLPRRVQSARPGSQSSPGWKSPAPDAASQPPPVTNMTHREQEARSLAISYLDVWSNANHVTLAATPSFYASTVAFHGRKINLQTLLNEKRRFVERWPERQYRYRPETMIVTCKLNEHSCHVRPVYDFDAFDLKLGRRSRGAGLHDLIVSFETDRAVIVSENSQTLGRPGTATR